MEVLRASCPWRVKATCVPSSKHPVSLSASLALLGSIHQPDALRLCNHQNSWELVKNIHSLAALQETGLQWIWWSQKKKRGGGQVISIIIGVQDSPLILAYSRDQTSRLVHGRHFFFLFYNKILMLRDMSGKMRWSIFTQAPNLSLCTSLPFCLEWPYSK